MQYCGGKVRIRKQILEAISPFRREGQVWVEPFVGAGSVISLVEGPRIGADVDEGLISLLKAVRDGYVPPEEVDRETYYRAKSCPEEFSVPFVNFVRFACSFGGKSWGGFAHNKRGDNFARSGSRSLLKRREGFKGVEFVSSAYSELVIPEEALIYCDPPYKGTYSFGIRFDSDEFFHWCRTKASEGCLVFVSEYEAPEDFELIWERSVSVSLSSETNSATKTEKLFRAPMRRDS